MSATEWSRQGDAWDFLEALCELTAEAWLDTATRLRMTAHSEVARRELSALVRQDGLSLSVWQINDGLDTVAWHVSQHFRRAELPRRALSQEIIEAARTAALALLVRRQLGEEWFRLLYGPFQMVSPRPWPRTGSPSRVFMKSLCATATCRAKVQGPQPAHRP